MTKPDPIGRVSACRDGGEGGSSLMDDTMSPGTVAHSASMLQGLFPEEPAGVCCALRG